MPHLLIVSGIHANETAAAVIAARVCARLRARGRACAHRPIPVHRTLVGLLDNPAVRADSWALTPTGLDVDAYAQIVSWLIADPDLILIECHNSPASWPRFGLGEGRCGRWHLADMAPGSQARAPLGFWWNRDLQVPGQRHALLELPAVYRPVDRAIVRRRQRTLQRFAAAGLCRAPVPIAYLAAQTDCAATHRRGLLAPAAIGVVAAWMEGIVRHHREPAPPPPGAG